MLSFKLDIKSSLEVRRSARRLDGGEGGIRTLDRGLAYTPLAGERLQPLGHLTVF